jgi:hypothetical protein
VRALTEEGGGLEISIDGGPGRGRRRRRRVVRRQGGAPPAGALDQRPDGSRLGRSGGGGATRDDAAARAPGSDARGAAGLPAPRGDSAQALDLGAGEARTFLVGADEPALYRFESTGLLATAGALRTRTRASLLAQEQNGVGRNFALAAYLREGDYQLTVQPRGASAGHLGLELARAPIEEAGELSPKDLPARATIDPRRAVAYRWSVTEAGRFQVSAWGLRRPFAMRLEDADGWPVAAPLAQGQLTVDLEPGEYRLIVLPQAVAARAIVLAARERSPVELSGHGPHRLAARPRGFEPLARAGRGGAARAGSLALHPACATGVTDQPLRRDDGFDPRARRDVERRLPLPAVPNGGLVPPGRRLPRRARGGRVRARRPSRRAATTGCATASSCAPTTSSTAAPWRSAAPGELTLAVGSAAQVELASLGNSDVRARLMTELGER